MMDTIYSGITALFVLLSAAGYFWYAIIFLRRAFEGGEKEQIALYTMVIAFGLAVAAYWLATQF